MTRLGVVVNPTAGSGRGAGEGAKAIAALRERRFELVDLTGPTYAAALENAAHAVAADGVDALVVVGGDGLVHLGVGAVAGTDVPLGIVATGTGNDIPREMGLPVHDVDAAIAAIESGLASGGWRVDAMRVGPPGAEGVWCVGVLSAGFDAAVNELANRLTWPPGSLRYVRAIVTELARLRPFDYRVEIDGVEVWNAPGTLIAVANGVAIGGGIKIAPAAKFDDGRLQVVLAKQVSRRTLIRLFPSLYKGGHVGHPAVTVLSGRRVLVEVGAPPAGRGVSVPPTAMADGEEIGALPLHCEIHPGAVRILKSVP